MVVCLCFQPCDTLAAGPGSTPPKISHSDHSLYSPLLYLRSQRLPLDIKQHVHRKQKDKTEALKQFCLSHSRCPFFLYLYHHNTFLVYNKNSRFASHTLCWVNWIKPRCSTLVCNSKKDRWYCCITPGSVCSSLFRDWCVIDTTRALETNQCTWVRLQAIYFLDRGWLHESPYSVWRWISNH